jgi:uncharacterized protein YjiS (DUF1127 family)
MFRLTRYNSIYHNHIEEDNIQLDEDIMGALPDVSTTIRLPLRAASETGSQLYRTLANATAQVVSALSKALERRRQRDDLYTLDARMLKDIGIQRADAEREAERPFWQG